MTSTIDLHVRSKGNQFRSHSRSNTGRLEKGFVSPANDLERRRLVFKRGEAINQTRTRLISPLILRSKRTDEVGEKRKPEGIPRSIRSIHIRIVRVGHLAKVIETINILFFPQLIFFYVNARLFEAGDEDYLFALCERTGKGVFLCFGRENVFSTRCENKKKQKKL